MKQILHFVLVVLFLSVVDPSIAQVGPIANFPEANNSIEEFYVDEIDQMLYVGGGLTNVGDLKSFGALYDTQGETFDAWPEANDEIRVILPDGSGGWFVGGDFTEIGGIPRRKLAHIQPNGEISTWLPEANASVYSLHLTDQLLYVGGSFDSLGTEARGNAGAINVQTGLVNDFNGQISSGYVYSLIEYGNRVYIGGSFSSVNGQSRDKMACFDKASGALLDWNPGPNSIVRDIVAYDSTIIVSGYQMLDQYEIEEDYETNFLPSATNVTIRDMIVHGNILYVAGDFTYLDGKLRNGLGAINLQTGNVTNWAPETDNGAARIFIEGNEVFVLGDFDTLGNMAFADLGKVDLTTGQALPFSGVARCSSSGALAVQGGKVFAGSGFANSFGGSSTFKTAQIDLTTNKLTEWNHKLNSYSTQYLRHDDILYMCGYFSEINGKTRNLLAAIDLSADTVLAWNPDVSGSNIQRMAIYDTTMIIVGNFDSVGGVFRDNIASVSLNTGTPTNFNPGANSHTRFVEIIGDTALVTGVFTTIGGQSRERIAALNAQTGAVLPWNPGANGNITSSKLYGDTLLVGGNFTTIAGQSQSYCAAFDISSGNLFNWDPLLNGEVYAFHKRNGIVYIGGFFTQASNSARYRICAVTADSAQLVDWHPQFSGSGSARAIGSYQDLLFCSGAYSNQGQTAIGIGCFRFENDSSIIILDTSEIGTQLCQGAEYSISFSSQGVFFKGNRFKVVLSDSNGDFSNSIIISQGARVDTGSFSIRIPDTIAAASGYRIRITSTIPDTFSLDNGTDLTIVSMPDFSISSNSPIFEGQTVTLSAPSFESYSWSGQGGNGSSQNFIVPGAVLSDAGLYSITVTGENGCEGESSTLVNVNPLEIPETDGMVRTTFLDEENDILYIGGDFNSAGRSLKKYGALIDETGSAMPTWPDFNSSVHTAISDGQGGWFVGGSFTAVGDSSRLKIAHISESGEILPWSIFPSSGTVYDILRKGDTLFLGGNFSLVNGVSRNNIAAIEISSQTLLSWDPNANDDVNTMSLSGNTLYVGGEFTAVGGQFRLRIAALNATTGTANPWAPDANNEVNDLEVFNGYVYVGGQFTSLGGQSRNRFGGVSEANGNLVSPLSYSFTSTVLALTIDPNDSILYVGGIFSSRLRTFALGSSGTAFYPQVDGTIRTLHFSDGILYIGGSFSTIGGQKCMNVAAIDPLSGTSTAWQTTTNSHVFVIKREGGNVFIGGSFLYGGGSQRNHAAAIDLKTNTLSDWSPNINDNVHTITASGNSVYIGGEFTRVGWYSRHHLAEINAQNGIATGWDPSPNDMVRSLLIDDSLIYAAGDFNYIDGLTRFRIARIDRGQNTGNVMSWGAFSDGSIYSLAINSSSMFIGGTFTSLGSTRRGIGSVSLNAGSAYPWNPAGANQSSCYATLLEGNEIYVGGSFTQMADSTRERAAKLHTNVISNYATHWNPQMNNRVYALARTGNLIMAGGSFTTVGGLTRNRLAIMDDTLGLPTAWHPNLNNTVHTISSADSFVYVGGEFTEVSGQPRSFLACLYLDTIATSVAASISETIICAGDSITIHWTANGSVDSNNVYTIQLSSAIGSFTNALALGSISSNSNDSLKIQIPDTISQGTLFRIRVVSSNLTNTPISTDPFTIDALPSFAISSNSPVCPGDTIELNANGGILYQWQGPNAFSSANANNSIPEVTNSNAGFYNVQMTNTNGCERSDSLEVVVFNTSGISTSINTPICTGDSLKLTASAGINFSWSGPNGFISSIQNPFIENATSQATGEYIAMIIDSNSCHIIDSLVAVVHDVIPVSITSNSPVCASDSLWLSADTGNSFSWTGPNGFSAASQNIDIPNAAQFNGGTYFVLAADSNGCLSKDSAIVFVYSHPTLSINNNSPVCEGDTLTFGETGTQSYLWSGPSGFTSTSGQNVISDANASHAGIYSVTATDSNGCEVSSAFNAVVISSSLAVTGDSDVCLGSPIQFQASGGTSYSWNGPNGFSSSLTTLFIPSAVQANDGTYTITIIDSNGCTFTDSINTIVNSLPSLSMLSNSPICEGQNLLLLSTSNGVSYSWSGPSGFSSTTQNPQIIAASPLSSGNYTVTSTSSEGCIRTQSISVTVYPAPLTSVSSNTPICSGQTLSLIGLGNGSISWTGPLGFSSSNSVVNIPNADASNSGTFVFSVLDSNGCSAQESLTAIVNATPSAIANSNSPVCEGQALSLSSSGGASYNWIGPNSFSSSLQNPAISGSGLSNTGVYSVSVTSSAGCTAILTTSAVVNTKPYATASATNVLCEGDTISLLANGGSSYSWSGPSGFSSMSQNNEIAGAVPAQSGSYQVIVTATNGCMDTTTANTTVNEAPIMGTSSNSPVCQQDTLFLAEASVGTYTWFGPDGFYSSAQNPFVVGMDSVNAGYYYLSIENSNGCSNSDSILVTVIPTSLTVELVSSCDSFNYYGTTYTQSGLYTHEYLNQYACDSLVEIDLTIFHSSYNQFSENGCDSFVFNGQNFFETGLYSFNHLTSEGCDSIVDLDLTIYENAETQLYDTACISFNYNGQWLDSTATYNFAYQTIQGCDSLVTLNLMINDVDTGLTNAGSLLIANDTEQSYQWLETCDAISSPIAGATDYSFSPTSNGWYSVIVYTAQCADTSACLFVGNVGSESIKMPGVTVYPNPTRSKIIISNHFQEPQAFIVISTEGQIVMSGSISQNNSSLDFGMLSAGVYTFRLVKFPDVNYKVIKL